MTTKITFIGNMPVEQEELDQLGDAARDQLNDLVLAEYEQTGQLTSVQLCEAVEAFENYAEQHVRAADCDAKEPLTSDYRD